MRLEYEPTLEPLRISVESNTQLMASTPGVYEAETGV
jgi:hypothetical protein